MNDEVNNLLTFPPSSLLQSPVFVAHTVLLARICNIYIVFWNYNSDLILIMYWNGFRSSSLQLPFLLYSCDLYLIVVFLFKNFFQKSSLIPVFCGVVHIWKCLPIILDLPFPQHIVLVAQSSLIPLWRKISESISVFSLEAILLFLHECLRLHSLSLNFHNMAYGPNLSLSKLHSCLGTRKWNPQLYCEGSPGGEVRRKWGLCSSKYNRLTYSKK